MTRGTLPFVRLPAGWIWTIASRPSTTGGGATQMRLHRCYISRTSPLPFLSGMADVEEYQHRARVRAHDGDLYATVTPTDPTYEACCRVRLDLGDVRWFLADGGDEPLAVARASQSGKTFDRLVDVTKQSGELLIHPYMAIDDVWELGAQLARATDASVAILPGPT